jgi:transcriptional regulator with XRE-family HTH domain
MMVKLSELRSAAEVHEQNMLDPEYKREYDRTKLANDVAVRVLAYRAQHRVSQAELARMLGMRQPNIARLESGEHEPSLSTLVRLSLVLGGFSIDIKGGGLMLRETSRPRVTPAKKLAHSKGGSIVVPSERQPGRRSTPSRSSLAPAARHSRKVD